MKIFGLSIITAAKYEKTIAKFKAIIADQEEALDAAFEAFPFVIDQVVYDITLKNAKGRYTKSNPSFEYSTINEIVVDERNYFSLVNRFRHNDVFYTREEAKEYLRSICK